MFPSAGREGGRHERGRRGAGRLLDNVGMSAVVVADLAVGLAFLALGGVARSRSRGLAALAVAVALTWWLGSLWTGAAFWHRGPLVHLLLAYPSVWPRLTWVRGVIVLGYAVAAWPSAWANAWVAVTSAAVLVVARVAVSVRRGSGVAARQVFEVLPVVLVAAAIAGDAIARAVVPLGGAVRPSFLVFCGAMVAAAALQAAGLRHSPSARVADLVVELGESGQAGLRAELSRLLGDPDLELGTERSGEFVDDSGQVLVEPTPGGPRRAVVVTRRGAPDLMVLHSASAWDEPVLREAVERWAALSQANAELRDRARASLDEVAASRRRLLVAADVERERLGRRIEVSVADPLRDTLGRLSGHPGTAPLVRSRLGDLLGRLGDTSHDLAPPDLDLGLVGALERLAAQAPLPVRVESDGLGASAVSRSDDPATATDLERAAYFVCAEALTNALKHAEATQLTISVERHDRWLSLSVADDGRGGAAPSDGSGLAGLEDRVAALGGTMSVDSAPGSGTVVRVALPR